MEKGVYTLAATDVDALSVARQVVAASAQMAAERSVGMALFLNGMQASESDTFLLRGEELLFYSMLANLVKNAVEASPAGSLVSLSFRDGDPAIISLHNEGAIPQDIRGRFFEKFATPGKSSGTGLGAYSARLIATTLGGAIAFTSSESEGTTISITLPCHEPSITKTVMLRQEAR